MPQEVASAAAPHAAYVNDRQAVYDATADRTFVAYLGLARDCYVTYWDHATGTAGTPVLVGAYPISDDDDHGAPSICVDLNGFIHLVWGSHSTQARHSKSDSPRDITAWTTNTLTGDGTYPSINCDPASGDLIVLNRAGAAHSATFPSHEYLGIRVSADGGSTWSAYTWLASTEDAPGADSDFYLYGSTFGADGLLHYTWTIAQGSGHDATRTNVYHAAYDHTDGHSYAADGTDLGAQYGYTEMDASCRVSTRVPVGVITLGVAAGNDVAVAFTAEGDQYVCFWDGAAWTETSPGLAPPDVGQAWPAVWPITDGWAAAVPAMFDGFGSVWNFTWNGTNWTNLGILLAGDDGEGYGKVSPARGGGPVVAATLQDPAGWDATDATVADLRPLNLIFAADSPTNVNGVVAFDTSELFGPPGGGGSPYSFQYTPVGVPRGIVVAFHNRDGTNPNITSMTYGGQAMTFVISRVDATTEPCWVGIWFLGADIPVGEQTLTIAGTSIETTVSRIGVVSLTASADLQVVDSDGLQENQINPQVSLDSGALDALRVWSIFSGLGAIADLTPVGGANVEAIDYTNNVSLWSVETAPGAAGSVTVGYTAASDDVAFVAVAVAQVQPPAAPTNPAAVADSETQITVTWDDVADETGFRVERSLTGAGAWSDVSGNLAAGTTTYPDTGLTCSTQYFYRVFAFNGGGDSPASTTVDATTDACTPPSPSGNRMGSGAIRRLGGSR